MSQSFRTLEVELKFRLGQADFQRLYQHLSDLGTMDSRRIQVNHYFDLPGCRLRRLGGSLRIRTYVGGAEISCKLPAGAPHQQNVSQSYEHLWALSEETARDLIESRSLAGLPAQVRTSLSEVLPLPLDQVKYFGSLSTDRTSFQYGGLSHPLLLDESTYLGNVDYEVEWEIYDTAPARAHIVQLFKTLVIVPLDGTVSKAGRFFRRLSELTSSKES